MIIAKFEIPYVQYLNETGNFTQSPPEWILDKKIVTHFYQLMKLARTFDQKAIRLQRTGKLGTYAPIQGQEAVGTAIGHALEKNDIFIPYYRDYAAQYQRGVAFSEILSYWGGDERGSQFQSGSQDLPICVPIASQCLHAAGVAFAFQYRKEARVALVCIGDGGTSEGDFYEAMNVAGTWQLPLVFVINNNQWAISVPLKQQTHSQTLAQKAIAAGFDGVQIDGNDIFACRLAIGEAIEKARRGGGPTLIEACTYRLSDHTTADDAGRYQPPEEVQQAQPKEPLIRLKKLLETEYHWSKEDEAAVQTHCDTVVEEAVQAYLQRPKQALSSVFDYHFHTLPPYLIEQKAIALEDAEHVG